MELEIGEKHFFTIKKYLDLAQGLVLTTLCSCGNQSWSVYSIKQKGPFVRVCGWYWSSSQAPVKHYIIDQWMVPASTCVGILPSQFSPFSNLFGLEKGVDRCTRQVYNKKGLIDTVNELITQQNMICAVEEVKKLPSCITHNECVITDARHNSTTIIYHTSLSGKRVCISNLTEDSDGSDSLARPLQLGEEECTYTPSETSSSKDLQQAQGLLLSNDPKPFTGLCGPEPTEGVGHTPPSSSPTNLALPVTPRESSLIHLIRIGGDGKKLESWLREPASPKQVVNLCIGMVQFEREQKKAFGCNDIWKIKIDGEGNAHIPDDTLEANVPVSQCLSALTDIVAFYFGLPSVQKDHCRRHDINCRKLSVFVKMCGNGTDRLDYALMCLGAVKYKRL